jgi:hypothetical protein
MITYHGNLETELRTALNSYKSWTVLNDMNGCVSYRNGIKQRCITIDIGAFENRQVPVYSKSKK